MADQPIDPGRLTAWIEDMRAQVKRIEMAQRRPDTRSNAADHAPYRKRRRKRASGAVWLQRHTMTQ